MSLGMGRALSRPRHALGEPAGTDGRTDGRTNGRTDGRTDGRTNGRTAESEIRINDRGTKR